MPTRRHIFKKQLEQPKYTIKLHLSIEVILKEGATKIKEQKVKLEKWNKGQGIIQTRWM